MDDNDDFADPLYLWQWTFCSWQSARDYDATRFGPSSHRDAIRTSYLQLASWSREALFFVQTEYHSPLIFK